MKRRGHHSLRHRDPGWTRDFGSSVSTATSSRVGNSGGGENFLNLGAANSSTLFPELGAFSSLAPSTSSGFGYSQKNFHISDGNLYSVLSPFQARRSSARPSFLKGQSCVTSTSDVNRDSMFAGGQAGSDHVAADGGRRTSASKLKFHHQDMPPPYGEKGRRAYRSGKSAIHAEDPSSFSASTSSWFDEPPFAMDTDPTSLLSKRLKSQRATSGEDVSARSASSEDRFFRHHDEWETEELSLNSRKSFHHRYHLLDSKTSSSKRSEGTWSFDDDEEDEELDGRVPLNLCMADRQRKLSSMRRDLGERLRRKVDPDSPMGFAFDREFPRDRKFSLSSLFDDLSTRSKSRSQDDSQFFENSHVRFEEEEEEPRVLDLSMKQHQSSRPPASPLQPPVTPCTVVCPQETVDYPPSPLIPSGQFDSNDWKRTKFPQISEMFQNMRLQDDDFMQDAVKRYNATRQFLMQTHPEMFGYDWTRSDLVDDTGKLRSEDDDVPQRSSKDGESSREAPQPPPPPPPPHRPKSWNVPPQGFGAPTRDEADSRSESTAEARFESASFLSPPPSIVQMSTSPDGDRRQDKASTAQQLPPLIPSASFSLVQQTQWQSQNHPQTTRRSASAPSIAANTSGRVTRGRHGESKSKVSSTGAVEVAGGGIPKATKSSRQRKNLAEPSSSQYSNDISICKFKLIKGANPGLEEKKSFFVPLNRSSSSRCTVAEEPATRSTLLRSSSSRQLQTCADVSLPSATTPTPFFVPSIPGPSSLSAPSTSGTIGDKFRTYKIHVGSQEDMGRKLAAGKQRLRRRSRKALAREKLEATFREQGFLIKTQQVSSAEGAVYCKFRQLRKFTRYLFKSWKDYLPKELDEIATVNPPPSGPHQPP